MNLPSSDVTEVFIVRVWLEPREIAGALPLWRGHIQRVTGGEQRYLLELQGVVEFIRQFEPADSHAADAPPASGWWRALLRRLAPWRHQ